MAEQVYAVRGSRGYSLRRGVEDGGEKIAEVQLDPKEKLLKCLKFSNDGNYLAYCDATNTVVVDTRTGKECFSAPLPRTSELMFSPLGSYLVVYQLYAIWGTRKNEDGSERQPEENLRIYSVKDGWKLLVTTVAKKQSSWCPQFTADESIMLRTLNSEVGIYHSPNFERHAKKVTVKDLEQIAISPGRHSYLACFIPALKGQPALVHLKEVDAELTNIRSKSTFHGSSCKLTWNSKGSAFLACATEDVDKTNKSYYGSSKMYCLPVSSKKEDFQVDFDKAGPIYEYEWAPAGDKFCVCYGYMPSKVSVYDLRGDVVWAIGEGHRNEVHFNRFGNILATCAFGNLSSGKIELWDVAQKKEITHWEVNCTSHFGWAPDGQHFYAATTAPRLRINNCFRIFHYTHKLLHEELYDKEELWEVVWQPDGNDPGPAFEIEQLEVWQKEESEKTSYKSGAVPFQRYKLGELPRGSVKDGVYVPPALRGNKALSTAHKKEPPPRNDEEKGRGPVDGRTRKVKDLTKKLAEIKVLKDRSAKGEKLEINQQWKIDLEEHYTEQLKQLTLAAAASQ